GWVDDVELLPADEHNKLQKNIQPVKLVLLKLRKLGYKLIHSTTILLPAWHEILGDLRMTKTNMLRDVSTRWNSTFDMLEYSLGHRKAVDTVTQRQELGLRKFELTDHEWEIAGQLCDVLKLTLNRYYQMTDKSKVYRIAMVLHPRHKLSYFKTARWQEEWIETAEVLVRTEFNRSYLEL
ncbi:hypothetical protein EV424DRAFT_1268979, partial [Suillus variegatus]